MTLKSLSSKIVSTLIACQFYCHFMSHYNSFNEGLALNSSVCVYSSEGSKLLIRKNFDCYDQDCVCCTDKQMPVNSINVGRFVDNSVLLSCQLISQSRKNSHNEMFNDCC